MGANSQNIKSFKADLSNHKRKNGKRYTAIKREVVTWCWGSLTDKTRVDTGRARASWNTKQGSIDTKVPKAAEWARGQYLAPISKPTGPGKFTVSADDPIYITSSLHYIGYLEYLFKDYMRNLTVQGAVTFYPSIVKKAIIPIK